MNFMQKCKRNGGFTLVELIVVIAILAILAGVAVPAYTGYIKKAEEAADQQLVGAINTAFAAACLENGIDASSVTQASIAMTGEDGARKLDTSTQLISRMKSTDITLSTTSVTPKSVPSAKVAKINEAFLRYYTDVNAEFSVVYQLHWNGGSFEGLSKEEATLEYTFGDSSVSLNIADREILAGDNAFSNRGSEALLGDIGTLETYLAGGYIGADILEEIGASEEFFFAVGDYLGMKQDDYDDSSAYMEAIGTKLDSLDNENAANNALIMYAASNAANATDAQIKDLFTGTVTSNIEVKNADGTRNNAQTMANAALAYGMYTAYVQQYPDAANADNFALAVNTPEFANYYASEQGQADLEAYMAAMNMVSDNTNNSTITGSILETGIVGNTDLAALMQEIMGN